MEFRPEHRLVDSVTILDSESMISLAVSDWGRSSAPPTTWLPPSACLVFFEGCGVEPACSVTSRSLFFLCSCMLLGASALPAPQISEKHDSLPELLTLLHAEALKSADDVGDLWLSPFCLSFCKGSLQRLSFGRPIAVVAFVNNQDLTLP